ncbi:MAG: hypothetical protein RL670_312 [Actinomycetota bacterium]
MSSPQGRFAAGASRIDGQLLLNATAIGKQLFLHFETAVLRIHLGIYGKWTFGDLIGDAPEPVGQVRARFLAGSRLADLRGPTACELLDEGELADIGARLGPDPLNPDPKNIERERFAAAVKRSAQPIGLLLMNQAVIAGVGNVYRAELLFRAKLDPYRAGKTLPDEVVKGLWDDAAYLMRFGVDTGVMVTREELLGLVPDKEDRYFVYKRNGQPCRVCANTVQLALMASRKLYWCGNCQR